LVGLLGSSPEQDEQECPGPGELLGSWSSEDVSEQDDRRVRSGPEFAESEEKEEERQGYGSSVL
jgi:hypothetical protein